MPELSEVLAEYQGTGYVVAPAGFGKTHLIAESVSRSNRRQLVLTHTYAGVNVLRRKMRELKVNNRAYHIDTIASWALRLCLSYPAASGWTIDRPKNEQWSALYRACSVLLDSTFIHRIVRASYAGLYVDEYQDCSTIQHQLVLRVAALLPCRLLGDPLQGIFDFNDQPIDWEKDVSANFESLGEMQTPHRWNRAGTPRIGTWLRAVRDRLEHGQAIDLTRDLPQGVTLRIVDDEAQMHRIQADACRFFRCAPTESIIAIHKGTQQYKLKCHALAKSIGGKFSSIEEIEGKELFLFVEKYQAAPTHKERFVLMIDFAGRCMTKVKASLPATALRGEHTIVRQHTRNPAVARAANALLANATSEASIEFLKALKELDKVHITRADLFGRAIGMLRKHVINTELSLVEAAERYQTEFRHTGRPTSRRNLLGTTLLVKGLEFDHAIVLDAASLSRKELYVALTRGAKSLTIISTATALNPTG